jgi:acyl-coenzyme A synthetase/AMP-(fatty) acid ligase
VREVAVTGVPDAEFGQSVRAFVVLNEDVPEPDPGELRAFARRERPGFKVPTSCRFVPELPRNASGKVLRRLLAEQGCRHRTADGLSSLHRTHRAGSRSPVTLPASSPAWTRHLVHLHLTV